MSYAATTTLINNCNSDAAFRTWGSAYASKFASMGLVQTADTGQINWATVTVAAGANTAQGYEIWRFADTMQATAPIFIKIEYGSGAAAANGALWFTLGNGSNGAGTLTGVLSTRQQVQTTATATAIAHYWSGDTNRMTFAAVGASAATSSSFSVERTVDSTGAVTSEGALMTYRGTSACGQQAWNQQTGPYTATWETSLGGFGPSLAPFGAYGTQVAIYPIYHTKGIFLQPGLNIFAYDGQVMTGNSTISFTVYGATHTYMTLPTPQWGSMLRVGFSAAGNQCIMMRYE